MLSIVARTALVALLCTGTSRAFVAGDADPTTLETTTCTTECEAKWISRLTDLKAENEQLRADLEQCRSDSVKQPLLWRTVPSVSEPPGFQSSPARHRTTTSKPIPIPNSETQPPFWPIDLSTKRFEDFVGEDHSTHRRKILATQSPSAAPSASAVPTTFTPIPTTQNPSAAPSVSLAPTTEGVTSHGQLTAHVADTAVSEVVIEAPIAFPSQAPITVESGRSVSIVGGDEESWVTLDGAGQSRLFLVNGGTLSLAFLNLVNGSTRVPGSGCDDDYERCAGATLLVMNGGSLMMRHCDIRGGGPGESTEFGAAWVGAGVSFYDPGTTGELYGVGFYGLRSVYAAAVGMWLGSEDSPLVVNMYHCHVDDSSGYGTAAVVVGWYNCIANFYDCVFTRNHQQALVYYLADSGKVVRCRFSDNTGVDAWTGTTSGGLGVGATPLEPIEIRDCVFERNVAAAGADGGGAGVSGGTTIWRNVTFISNSASAGGALELSNFAHATMIGCNFPKNSADDCGSSFSTDKSTLVVFNSTVSENVGFYCGMFQIRETVFSFHNCTFRDYVSTAFFNVGLVAAASSGTFTDCLVMNNQAPGSDGLNAQDGSIVRIERSVWVNNRVEGGRACLTHLQAVRSRSTTATSSIVIVKVPMGPPVVRPTSQPTVPSPSRIHVSSVARRTQRGPSHMLVRVVRSASPPR